MWDGESCHRVPLYASLLRITHFALLKGNMFSFLIFIVLCNINNTDYCGTYISVNRIGFSLYYAPICIYNPFTSGSLIKNGNVGN